MSGSKWVDQSFSNKWQSQRQIGRLHRQWTILYIIKTLTTSDFFKKNQIKRKNGCLLFIHTQVCAVGFFPLQNEKINWVKMGGKKNQIWYWKKNLKNSKVLHPDSSQTGRSALLGTQPSQVLEHMHPGSQTHTLSPTYILLCLVTQNGSCKIWWAVSKASLKDLKAEESRKGKENKWQLQNICLDAVLCF